MNAQSRCVETNSTWHFWLKELESVNGGKSPQVPVVKLSDRQRIDFNSLVPGAYLTGQEARCIRELLLGKTIKQAAESMELSHRSVEFYFNNIKQKFKVKKKKILLAMIKDSGLM